MHTRKNFIAKNEEFPCENCGHQNPKLKGSYRNHCQNCLYSLHVDENIPGDRASECHGLMIPIQVDQDGKKGWIIYHKCQKCGKMISNMAADDDNFDKIILLTQKINESARIKKVGR
ncbi:MAG: RNHCP domain-containing protein [Candidatus Gracilibacteria bacterium]|jgi:DNA-directed RNA polymerase subunit RPC12/RpoP